MRQNNAFKLCRSKMKFMLCILLMLLSSISILHADVAPSNVAVSTSFPGSSNRINGSGYVDLAVTWQGDSPAFTAKYSKDGKILFTDTAIQDNSTSARIQASVIGDTGGSAVTISVQIVDSAGRSSESSSQGIIVDTRMPNISATITNGPNFSKTSSVRIQITSDKEINAPTVTCEGTSATMEGSLSVGTAFVYNLQLNDTFTNGSHVINISAKDTTEPAGNANVGNSSVSFTVGTSASGNTTIDGVTPASPTNSPNISITGSAPNGTNKVEILDNGNHLTDISGANTNWSTSITPEEGVHNYVAVSYDSLNQEISRSAAYNVVIDRTAPTTPTVSSEGIETQTNKTSQIFNVAVEGYSTEVSTPVWLQGYNNGTAVGSKMNVTTSGSPINVTIPLTDGANAITFRTIDGAGNQSEPSAAITINKSSEASAVVSSVMIDSYSVPAPAGAMLGSGNHTLTINFNSPVSASVPTIEVICGGGSKISVTDGNWSSNQIYVATVNVPANGGVGYDGAATVKIADVKDTYNNILPAYEQASAFNIDSSAPKSTINGTEFYVSSTNKTIALNGTVDDGEAGSGVDFLTLVVKNTADGSETATNIPLQTGAQSPWSYSFDASSLTSGVFTLVTRATDRAVPTANVENISGKTGVRIVVDTEIPVVSRISLNNTGVDVSTYGDPCTIASDVSRIVAVATDAGGSGLDLTSSNYIVKLTGPNGEITGERTNNGQDTVYFDFQTLTDAGNYTITFTPVDKAGNAGETQQRSFILNKSAPDAAEFAPSSYVTANKTDENLANSQVKVTLSSSGGSVTPSYANSTISVKYNGLEVGTKQASEEALIAIIQDGNLKTDQSHDGNYYITVVPHSSTGITGTAITSNFTYDTQAPVVVESEPSLKGNESWFGKDTKEFRVVVSDAPKDIIENYSWQYVATHTPAVPGDSTWYNGNGSGVNMSVSSFSWTMDSESSVDFNYSGNQMTVKAPNVPDDTAAGATQVTVSLTLADSVTQGTDVPNKNTLTKTLMFDYVAPEITLTTESGKKFCKNLLKIAGKVEDIGSNENLLVESLEYSEDGNVWNSLSSESLPSKSTDFKASIDIANKSDGTYKVMFRAVDRAGNRSDTKEFSYIVDRTGPAAPELTIPLSDYTVNKRTQSFKWVTVNGADAYLLQISDDSSFNNILNCVASTDYPDLKGVVSVTTDGSYSLPKDGTYYWRVASIEKCMDGYNISSYSNTRKVIVDSVKPYVVSVSPTPSSSNIVSTGMVTFNIRFSETIDATIEPSVMLTSAGGQVMKIEKTSCSGDTWIGTTVIPKNNSALYDGNAVISIEGAVDVAGNKMEADTSHYVVVNTGPSFTTKLFSNPANEYEITIVTKASEALQSAPSVSVKQSSVKTPVTMNFLKDRFYSGSYKIDKENPGSAYIYISGTDLYGMVGNSTVEFVIAEANASARMNVSTASGRAVLKAAESSTYNTKAIYMIDRECLESPFSNDEGTTPAAVRASAGIRASANKNKNSELVGVVGLEEVGPVSAKLKKCMLYTANLSGEKINLADTSKAAIYRQDANGNWIYQGGEMKDNKISAQLTGLGRLALMVDNTSPRLSSMTPSNQSKLDTSTPEIKGQFEDNGSGLNASTFKLFIDGLQVKNVELENDGSFSYKVKTALKEGKHEIECEVADKSGNMIRKSFAVDAPQVLAVGTFIPYPNPARGNRISFAYNFGTRPDDVTLKIYDVAGHLVAKFDSSDFSGKESGSIRWDLMNEKGKRVANGTYIYRAEVTVNGGKNKIRGKFSVLR